MSHLTLMCPASVRPSKPSEIEMAEEGGHVVEGLETDVIGVDDEYRDEKPEFGKGEAPWSDLECGVCDDQAQKPLGLKGPHQPSAEDLAFHNLNHFPYHSWCPHGVAA